MTAPDRTAPSKIWATGNSEMSTGSWNAEPVLQHPSQVIYHHEDTVKALVEAARLAVSDVAHSVALMELDYGKNSYEHDAAIQTQKQLIAALQPFQGATQ